MKPALLNYTLRKKKCSFLTFLRGEFSLFLQVLKLLSIAREPQKILEQVFCTLLPRAFANKIHCKVHLPTLFSKRNATFYAAFLLKESVGYNYKEVNNFAMGTLVLKGSQMVRLLS